MNRRLTPLEELLGQIISATGVVFIVAALCLSGLMFDQPNAIGISLALACWAIGIVCLVRKWMR